jgi:hypothetical protein
MADLVEDIVVLEVDLPEEVPLPLGDRMGRARGLAAES